MNQEFCKRLRHVRSLKVGAWLQPFLTEKPTEPSLIDANSSVEEKTGYFCLIDCKCMYVVQCACVSVSHCKLSPDCVGAEL